MPKIEKEKALVRKGSGYPEPFQPTARDRTKLMLGDVAGLTDFGVNLTRLPPGSWSSQRHWHSHEDEFVYILEGELVLVTDAGEQVMKPGDCAGFPHGAADGHCLINRSSADAVYLEVGSRRTGQDACTYPDVDMLRTAAGKFVHKDGAPY
jgi:uncharacterized cupin superfamily protein